MLVKDYLVYRVISVEKATCLNVGGLLPIPNENKLFDGSIIKKETEDCFERIRASSFNHLISRKSCLFVLPYNMEYVQRWLSDEHPHDDCNYALLTIKLDGELIWCDQSKYTDAGVLARLRVEIATDYWREAGDEYKSFELPEGLFRGRAVLIKIDINNHIAPAPL